MGRTWFLKVVVPLSEGDHLSGTPPVDETPLVAVGRGSGNRKPSRASGSFPVHDFDARHGRLDPQLPVDLHVRAAAPQRLQSFNSGSSICDLCRLRSLEHQESHAASDRFRGTADVAWCPASVTSSPMRLRIGSSCQRAAAQSIESSLSTHRSHTTGKIQRRKPDTRRVPFGLSRACN